MLCDKEESVCRIAFSKFQCIKKNSHYQSQIIKYQDSETFLSQSNDGSRVGVRKIIWQS